jgi:mono/diheme cytochrome c family protein
MPGGRWQMKLNFSSIGYAILTAIFILSGSGKLQAAAASQRFQDECSECHGEAKEFALDWLAFKDGNLTATGVEKPVAEFLKTHQGLTAEDIKYYVDLLTRVARDAGLK